MEEYRTPKLIGKKAPMNRLVLPDQHKVPCHMESDMPQITGVAPASDRRSRVTS